MQFTKNNLVVLTLIVMAALMSCNSNTKGSEHTETAEIETVKSGNAPFIRFKKKKHNFGRISDNKKVTVSFDFENEGETPLIIQKVTTSCGCTASEWTQQPLKKANKGHLKITFDPKGRKGTFSKSIFVKSNAENDVVLLKITGEIVN
jgi:hypothetical protein